MSDTPNLDELTPLLRRARDEDLGGGDLTSEGTIPATASAVGTLLAKERGVLCGTFLLETLAKLYDPTLQVELVKLDGDPLAAGDRIGLIRGPARAMLAFERVALNFLQRLSGVATATRAFVDAVAGTAARILDTRKTTPGWRTLEKYAVRCGGGTNHRAGLFDAILVKDNHIALGHQNDLPALARGLRAKFPGLPIEIEVDTLDQLSQLLRGAGGAMDMILLDNMTVEQMRRAVAMRNESGARVLLEASGGVSLSTVRAIAEAGVERISVGAVTHSAKALDISLEISS
ncbi:MAG: carboxylating nicotinate-nucleotide diphosphorylase [Phycisphaerae bacterium]|nr:carboxylating nicotinate-nucleotide diphosphorylase [Phycisphaerae bacterium]